MKKLFTLFSMMAVGASLMTAVAVESQLYVATTTEAGTLEAVLGDNIDKIAELKVVGPVNVQDFNAMWRAGMYGTELLDLSEAIVEGGRIPDCALSNLNSKPIPEGTEYPVKFKKIVLGESVTEIGVSAFATAYRLEEVQLPRALNTINQAAFEYCWSLKEIEIPEGVEVLPAKCFNSCTAMTHITLPSTLKRLEASCLERTGLLEVSLPEGLEVIGKKALYFSDISEVAIPDGCAFDSDSQFSGSRYLRKVVLPEGMTEVPEEAFAGCMNLETVVFPSTLTSIGKLAFDGCAFKTLKLPEGVRRIEAEAFVGNNLLEAVVLPSSLEFLGQSSFQTYRNEVTTFYCAAAVPPECELNSDGTVGPFGSLDTVMGVLCVYAGSEELYRSSPVWSAFFGQAITGLTPEMFDQLVASEESVTGAIRGIDVRADGGDIVIEGDDGEAYAVACVDGRMVAQGALCGGAQTRVSVTPGVYVVKAGTSVSKLAVGR